MKINCWEFKKCGRQVGGEHAKDLGICKAAIEDKLDGVHDGKKAGRACWVISGTLCTGMVQGTFAQKYETCNECDFYKLVRKEEGLNFKLLATLLEKLK